MIFALDHYVGSNFRFQEPSQEALAEVRASSQTFASPQKNLSPEERSAQIQSLKDKEKTIKRDSQKPSMVLPILHIGPRSRQAMERLFNFLSQGEDPREYLEHSQLRYRILAGPIALYDFRDSLDEESFQRAEKIVSEFWEVSDEKITPRLPIEALETEADLQRVLKEANL